jgi:two-component system sensor histidine kinase RegB
LLRKGKGEDEGGLGLGFFIAKTLIERGGGTLRVENRVAPATGAVVRLHWRRDALERAESATAARTDSESVPSLAIRTPAH